MSESHPLALCYLSSSALPRQPDEWRSRMLGQVRYGLLRGNSGRGDWPSIDVHTPRLDGTGDICEVWCAPRPISDGTSGGVRFRHTEELLFGTLTGPGTEPAAGGTDPLQAATAEAYREIFQAIDGLGYPFLLRAWNYFDRINEDSRGVERYRQFNAGRQDAFIDAGRAVSTNVPAACALGALEQPLTICFLASRTPPLPIENPRQVSAYDYPPEYGPRSPTFSRAALVRLAGQDVLFVSGTASIVGHRTQHPDDPVAQTRECVQNLQAVLSQANGQVRDGRFTAASLFYKVYIRHPEHAPSIQAELRQVIPHSRGAALLQADICRQDLLVEIEATAGVPVEVL